MRDLPATDAPLRDSDAADRVRERSAQAEGATLKYRETEARAESDAGSREGSPGLADLHARAGRLNGTLDAARTMLAMLDAEVRWARRSGGLRQFHPRTLLARARQRANEHMRKIENSGLFDVGWYLWSNPEVEASGEDPVHHYLRLGWKQGRDPSPFFSVAWYLDNHPDVRAAGGEPLSHYIDFGVVEGRDPYPLFKAGWYLLQNNDVARTGVNPLWHYISAGGTERRDPHPWFKVDWYLAQNPDVARSGLNPLFHYIASGAAAGLDPHPWFKGDWYLAQMSGAAARLAPISSALAGVIPPARRATSPVQPALARLLRMFHDESAAPVIGECLDVLDREQGAAPEPTAVALLAEKIAGLVRCEPPEDDLDASVIIEARGRTSRTLCCLYSVLALRTDVRFEIIVAEDGPAAAACRPIERAGGAVRFAGNAAAAIGMARGRSLVFLSNDAIALPGWLDELVATLYADRTIGLACSKCVTPSGALSATAAAADGVPLAALGSTDDACAPQSNYLDDVKDAGDVSVAIARAQWERIGGTAGGLGDLAARARAAGLRTVRQPLSAVVHHGEGRPAVAGEPIGDRPHILFVDHVVPQPDRDAGSRTTVQYLEFFRRAGFRVTYWPQDLYFDRPYVLALQRVGIEVIYGWNGIWPRFAGWLAANKSSLRYAYLQRPTAAANVIDELRANGNAKILFHGADVHFSRLEMEAEKTGNAQAREDARRMEHLEKEIWRKSDVVYYLSDSEIDLVQSTLPGKNAQIIPTFIFDPAQLRDALKSVRQQGLPGTRELFFIGGFRHSPNIDAMLWFVGEIWPRIVFAMPDARLVIAGSHPPPQVRALASDTVTVTGAISDEELARRYTEANVAIVPLRFGAGVKGKLLEAMSYGRPIVTTSVGVQGLAAIKGLVDVADEPEAFARAVLEILRDPNSRRDKVIEGLKFVDETLTAPAMIAALSREIPELLPYLARVRSEKESLV